ncbi:hypothetical protein NDA11_000178 [Ustilago hordei]|uniref:DDE Tnp4 domain-containing protein n=1 Tax=Ustilago hordei TaxID=120017 RepID=I2FTW9_USTHO|nr:uncharacterized protein UHO2_06134 [Ustilago hordei]KAJ1037870.1 hypothetical protein NDA10_000508 [Ustilago hordei]KAJ1574952.1 hypothetical protein NDA15_002343 [Ustilago hordei]KAJ1593969.1 hypothetical protein NDA12_001196 [Ustilago hordei]KAJ1594662.1 hypothetical protein NDA11_000178 [Ustilago hordei]KAJ1597491.1 hypothetical protein NDA14_001740 [Ustilago hordei]
MQMLDTDDTLSGEYFDFITLIAASQRAPPTNLKARRYSRIKRELDQSHFLGDTGFTLAQFEAIHDALEIPNPVRTREQDCVDSKSSFFLLCAFFRNRSLRSLEGQYGWSHSVISRVVRHLSRWIYRRWCHLLDVQSTRHRLVCPRKLEEYAAAVQRKFKLPRFWGAINGTIRPIAMPVSQQETVYNGPKQCHALKYQFISLPNGLIFCSMPYVDRRHDAYVVADTDLVGWARDNAKNEAGEQMYLYGDQAYGNSAAIVTAFGENIISSMQDAFNHIMNKFRIQVEWSIGMIPRQWPRFSVEREQKTGLTPMRQDWLVGVLLFNAKTCLVGNQVSMRLHCSPPSLEEYFSNWRVRRTIVSPDSTLSQSEVPSQAMADNEDETLVENVL